MRLVAAFSHRYDGQLVPDLLENLWFCDEVISVDDSGNNVTWYHEGEMRERLREMARSAGADWLLCIDPDERLEKAAGAVIRSLIEDMRTVVYRFHFREMYTPSSYRVDGVWGEKVKDVLFPLLPDQEFMSLPVHSQWAPVNAEYSREHTGLNIYHLKMIEPANRVARAELYRGLDPEHRIQSIGYDYLSDETGILLEDIAAGREYLPPYRPDYGITQLGVPSTAEVRTSTEE